MTPTGSGETVEYIRNCKRLFRGGIRCLSIIINSSRRETRAHVRQQGRCSIVELTQTYVRQECCLGNYIANGRKRGKLEEEAKRVTAEVAICNAEGKRETKYVEYAHIDMERRRKRRYIRRKPEEYSNRINTIIVSSSTSSTDTELSISRVDLS